MACPNRIAVSRALCYAGLNEAENDRGGSIMKHVAVMAALLFGLATGAQAKLIALLPEGAAAAPSAAAPARERAGAHALYPSEIPEPAVFLMMLVGLVLLGYRARRESSDTFS
jgi:hypothetical protein